MRRLIKATMIIFIATVATSGYLAAQTGECGGDWTTPGDTCTFPCAVGDTLYVYAFANGDNEPIDANIQVQATCGGVTVQCQASKRGYVECEQTSGDTVSADDDSGECTIMGFDAGEFFCIAEP